MFEKIRKMKNKKGFTLVELIVVLVILAILAALLIPALTGYIDKANGGVLAFDTTNTAAKYDAAVKSLSETKGDFKIELYNNGSVHTVQYWNSGWTVTYTDGAYGETTKAATPNPHTPTTITTK